MPTVLLITLFFLALTPTSAHHWKGMALLTCTLIVALVLDTLGLPVDSFAEAVKWMTGFSWVTTAVWTVLMAAAVTRGITQARHARASPPGNTPPNRRAQAIDLTIWYLTLLFGLAVWLGLLGHEASGELIVPFLLWLVTIARWSCNPLVRKSRQVGGDAAWWLPGKNLPATKLLAATGSVLLSVLLVIGLNRLMPGDHYYVPRFGNSQPPTYEVVYNIPMTGGGTGSCPVDPDEAAQYLPGTGAVVTTPFLFGTCSLAPMAPGAPGSLPAPLTTLARYRIVNVGRARLFLPTITLLDTATRTRLKNGVRFTYGLPGGEPNPIFAPLPPHYCSNAAGRAGPERRPFHM
ncbi:MAG TPA: hypothetical protein VFJ15_01025 [Oleiagrimonas sp.]|nr:hypothetical protein [Oleiagrimonas sp.]